MSQAQSTARHPTTRHLSTPTTRLKGIAMALSVTNVLNEYSGWL